MFNVIKLSYPIFFDLLPRIKFIQHIFGNINNFLLLFKLDKMFHILISIIAFIYCHFISFISFLFEIIHLNDLITIKNIMY